MKEQLIITKLKKLELEDGDILLVQCPASWSDERISHVTQTINHAVRIAGKRATVLSGPDTIEFTVVRKSNASS